MTCGAKKKLRDFQRQRVYDWEEEHVLKKDRDFVPFDQLQALVDYIWTQEGLEHPPKVRPMVKQRKDLGAATRLKVLSPENGMTSTVLIHELAHSMCATHDGLSNWHGARFVGVYIDLLAKYAGFDANLLRYTAKEAGVKFNHKGKVV